MICPYCGQENPASLDICGFCGGPLSAAAEPPADQPLFTDAPLEPLQTSPEPRQPEPAVVEPAESEIPAVQPAKPAASGIYGNRIWWIVGCVVVVCLVAACIAAAIGISRAAKWLNFFNPSQEILPTPLIELSVNTPLPVATLDANSGVFPEIATQQGFVGLFYDDFSDPNSGWDQVDEADYSTGYYNSAYRIKINIDMSDSWANPSERQYADTIIEVQATKNGGPDDNDFGVICRYLDTERFYYAVISSDGYYGIFKVTSESTDILGRDSLDYSDVIKQGFATNTIRFDCVGEDLSLYVNGQQLDQQTDNAYSTGNVGLIAGTYDTPGADILFDEFTVYSP